MSLLNTIHPQPPVTSVDFPFFPSVGFKWGQPLLERARGWITLWCGAAAACHSKAALRPHHLCLRPLQVAPISNRPSKCEHRRRSVLVRELARNAASVLAVERRTRERTSEWCQQVSTHVRGQTNERQTILVSSAIKQTTHDTTGG